MTQSVGLKPCPCPLCGEPLAQLTDNPDHFHPFTECFLEGTRVTPDQVPAWNRRPTPPNEAVEAARRMIDWHEQTGRNGHYDSLTIARALLDLAKLEE